MPRRRTPQVRTPDAALWLLALLAVCASWLFPLRLTVPVQGVAAAPASSVSHAHHGTHAQHPAPPEQTDPGDHASHAAHCLFCLTGAFALEAQAVAAPHAPPRWRVAQPVEPRLSPVISWRHIQARAPPYWS